MSSVQYSINKQNCDQAHGYSPPANSFGVFAPRKLHTSVPIRKGDCFHTATGTQPQHNGSGFLTTTHVIPGLTRNLTLYFLTKLPIP